MLTLEKFEEASELVKRVTNPTKLVYSDYLSEQCGGKVYLKPENMQHTGAYKIRGAYYKISTLTDEERERGLITASAGNHAQGVAFAAKKFGCKATIVMPTVTPLIKVERMWFFTGMCTMMHMIMHVNWQRKTVIRLFIPSMIWMYQQDREPLRWRSCRSFRQWTIFLSRLGAAD